MIFFQFPPSFFRCSNVMFGLEIARLCRVRYLGSKLRKLGLLLMLLFLLTYLTSGPPPSLPNVSPDQLVDLQAELGYLRAKLASCGLPPSSLHTDTAYPTIYVITPTYTRPVQKAELTRLKNVFLMVPSLHWVVVEDSPSPTRLVTNFLQTSGLLYTHLNVETPANMKKQSEDPRWSKSRGVQQRNLAIMWLRDSMERGARGVVYFADDDNTYTLELFEAIRGTKVVSVMAVGLVGGVMVERPKVEGGKVTAWSVGWGRKRAYATDMAGFAVSLARLLARPSALFPTECKRGHLESMFLSHLVQGLEELEPRGDGQVLVWHTRAEEVSLAREERFHGWHGRHSYDGVEV